MTVLQLSMYMYSEPLVTILYHRHMTHPTPTATQNCYTCFTVMLFVCGHVLANLRLVLPVALTRDVVDSQFGDHLIAVVPTLCASQCGDFVFPTCVV